jgi:hypothetical protein
MYPRKITFEFLTSEILIFQTTLDVETTKTKVIDLKKLYNFVIDNFFIWNNLFKKKYVSIFSHLKFENFEQCQSQTEKRPKQKMYISKTYTTLLLTTFSFEIIYPWKVTFEFITFEIHIL